MNHQRSHSELQEVATQQGTSTRRTTQDRDSCSSRSRRGSGWRSFWARLMLVALVIPGAWSFLSEEQEELLVELHNHYRGLVSPSASAMLPLKWDPGLKLIAEGYATKCIWNHNPELEDTGENLFAGTGALDLGMAVEKWFLEHLDYDFQNNSCDEDKMCGHYTQMVWADTHKVGCAFHLCNNMDGLDWERVSFLVCNYFPAGNYEGERPYVEGDWCSRCPENLQKCENNLCVADTTTSEPSLQPDDEGEEEEGEELEEVVPPPATSEPSLHPEVAEEEEEVVSPAATVFVQPASTTAASTPSTTTTSKPSNEHSEDETPPGTPSMGTIPPKVPSITKVPSTPTAKVRPTLGKEKKAEENMKKDETPKGTTTKEEKKLDVQIIYQSKEDQKSAASVWSPSLLVAGLTGILTLHLTLPLLH